MKSEISEKDFAFDFASNRRKGTTFSDGLSLMISRLSLISNKYFLFSWAKIVKIKWLILERRVVQIEQ